MLSKIKEFLKKKFGLKQLEEKVSKHEKEIGELREHILNKFQRARDPRVDNILNKMNDLEKWSFQVFDLIVKNKENMEKYMELFNKRLDDLESRIGQIKLKSSQKIISHEGKSFLELNDRPEVSKQNYEKETSFEWSTTSIEEGKLLWEKTTDAEREIIMELYDAGYPLTYNELANKLKKSVSTVKNHINNMKLKGFRFEETIGMNNLKRYSLDPRVKIFLTLRLNN